MSGKENGSGISAGEVLVVASVLGLLGIVAAPSYSAHRSETQAHELADAFRTYAAAFQVYADNEGRWPESQALGTVPSGMEKQLPYFLEESPIGGHWHWKRSPSGLRGEINLVDPTIKNDLLQHVDLVLDDGDIHTGLFRQNGNRLTLILERSSLPEFK